MSNRNKDEDKNKINVNIIYFIILIILLILLIIVSFKTGERIYKLITTDLEDKDTILQTDVAEWRFNVRVEY